MQALVYEGIGRRRWADVPDPKIVVDTDVIIRIDTTTICGTDLHILRGDVPEVKEGRVLGHEAVGTVVEAGLAVRNVKVDDRVLVSCISGCGLCEKCRRSKYGLCERGGGWLLGHIIDGVQAEYARIPFADFSCQVVDAGLSDEQLIYLSDVLPTAFEVGVENGSVEPGDVVAVVGSGPIGLAAVAQARLFTPAAVVAIDPLASRRSAALKVGADAAVDPDDAYFAVNNASNGKGADVTIEAVGNRPAFDLAMALVRKGGRVANVGVHGSAVELHLETLWSADITLTTGLVDTYSIPQLLKLMERGRLDLTQLTTHHFALGQAMAAYDIFSDSDRYEALKVVMTRED